MPEPRPLASETASKVEYSVILPDASEIESEEEGIPRHYANGRPSWRLQNPDWQVRIHAVYDPADIPRSLQLQTSQLTGVPTDARDVTLPSRHLDSAQTKIHVIISTKSGKEQAEYIFHRALEPLLDALGLKNRSACTVHRTTSSASITELTSSVVLPAALAGTRQTIILLSGDGGVLDILHTLLSSLPSPRSPSYTKPVIGLLPLGTGNALANSSGILSDSTLGVSTLLRGTPTPLPSFKVTFDPPARRLDGGDNAGSEEDKVKLVHGAVVFSWGLHASLVADSDTPEYRKLGSSRFQAAAKENLYPSDGSGAPHVYRGELSFVRSRKDKERGTSSESSRPKSGDALEEEEKEHDNTDADLVVVQRDGHAYVLATLCGQLEKGFLISPASGPLDGRLRLVHFGPPEVSTGCGGGGGGGGGGKAGGDAVMEIMAQAFDGGKHVTRRDGVVGYEAIDELRLRVDEGEERWRRVCVDGSIFAVPKGARVTVRMAEAGDGGVLDLLHINTPTSPSLPTTATTTTTTTTMTTITGEQ